MPTKPPRGFTLVEMLVIVAIVAIVSALLTVGISEGRKVAFRSTCLQNLYQLGVATKLYTADADGYLPPYGMWSTFSYEANRAGWKRVLMTYGMSDHQFYCPADPYARSATRGQWHDHLDTSYTFTIPAYAFAEPNTKTFRLNMDRIPDAAATPLYLDQEHLVKDDTGHVQRRWTAHGDQFNALYVDGHVQTDRLPGISR
ncbi:MAG: type II secretion system protein [Fimbriimonadaceae bacterium]|nr:type II secretion system protein [Fimbriimonadaceae bacterium]